MAAQVTRLLPRRSGRHRPQGRALRLRWPVSSEWLGEWWVAVAGIAAIAVTVVTVAVWFATRTERPAIAVASEPTPVVAVEASDSPSAAAPESTDPSAPATPPSRAPADTPTAALARFSTAVQQQVAAGNLDADAGRDLQRQASEIAARLQRGQSRKVVGSLRDLDQRLVELRRNGELNQAGYDALNHTLDPIIAKLS